MGASVFMELVRKRVRREWGICTSVVAGIGDKARQGLVLYFLRNYAGCCPMHRYRQPAARPVPLFVSASSHAGFSRGYVGYFTLYDFRDINSNKGAFKRGIDEQPCGREMLCDSDRVCTPQAFHSLASLDGPDDDHEDDGHPCLKRRPTPSYYLGTPPGGFFPFCFDLLFHFHFATFPPQLPRLFFFSPLVVVLLAFASSFAYALASILLIRLSSFFSRPVVHGCSCCPRLASSIIFASYGLPDDL